MPERFVALRGRRWTSYTDGSTAVELIWLLRTALRGNMKDATWRFSKVVNCAGPMNPRHAYKCLAEILLLESDNMR